ncbi:hypothetical protein AWM68_01705 [Fictibacillus phosphorivorans]|uniref:Helix-turn-helix domain-containing protein n=1 Tax=Fictibacillus phosphorivorans TaxID=1221500 RepID=A0A163SG82_9BACL|nr:hypothetical protein [Fictibacillus phosphorivorans]KZE69007.1 hypothetical protein AWM68_01705 [Fictibacillus phosphorivorans]
MRAGNIRQFASLSKFQNVKEFNAHKRYFIEHHAGLFTKSEFLAFEILSQYSVVVPGVANAKIDTLVEKSAEKAGGISRASFIRMLRKAKKTGILVVHKTYRASGGFAHNVFVFQRFDLACVTKVIQRTESEVACESKDERLEMGKETINLYKNQKDKDLKIRKEIASSDNSPCQPSLEDLDETFTPDSVPRDFVHTVKPFYNMAIEIYTFWEKAKLAYNQFCFDRPLEYMVSVVIDAFKTTVFHYKNRKIKATFMQYFYGTLKGMFSVEKRREHMARVPRYNWLDEPEMS